MKKLCCLPLGDPEVPNVSVTLNCMSACCESRTQKRERSYTKAIRDTPQPSPAPATEQSPKDDRRPT